MRNYDFRKSATAVSSAGHGERRQHALPVRSLLLRVVDEQLIPVRIPDPDQRIGELLMLLDEFELEIGKFPVTVKLRLHRAHALLQRLLRFTDQILAPQPVLAIGNKIRIEIVERTPAELHVPQKEPAIGFHRRIHRVAGDVVEQNAMVYQMPEWHCAVADCRQLRMKAEDRVENVVERAGTEIPPPFRSDTAQPLPEKFQRLPAPLRRLVAGQRMARIAAGLRQENAVDIQIVDNPSDAIRAMGTGRG